MASFKSYKEIITSLQGISQSIDAGNLTEQELEEFITLTKALYDRAIILNYKAMEAKVFDKKTEVEDKSAGLDAPPPPKEEKTASEEFAFDFSAPIEEDIKTESAFSEEQPVEEELKMESKIINDTLEEEKEDVPPATVEIIEDNEEAEKEISVKQSIEVTAGDEVYSFYEKFTKVHKNSLMDKLSAQKISTLKGAFGLNDRLQIISELFGGDATLFEKAIETLDQQESNDKARLKLSEIAAQHQWQPDHILVEDFAKMLERRYAE